MKRRTKIRWAVVGLGAMSLFGVGMLRARATQDVWVEAFETSHRHYHIDAGGFTPGHSVGLGPYVPVSGPPPIPLGNGLHFFAGHIFKTADANGEVSADFTIATSVRCNQMLPFVACDNEVTGGCLAYKGPPETSPDFSADPSYNYLTCP
jgi:hypothetical protein